MYQNSGSKIKVYGSKISVDKISDERKQSFLLTLPSVEKRLSLVLNIFITLTATATKHYFLNRS